jgi:hypothetical protein
VGTDCVCRLNLPGSSPWEVLDFGDVGVHVFNGEQRDYYDIESFYAAAAEVDLPFLEQSPAPGQQQGQQQQLQARGSGPLWTTKA